MRWLNKRRAVGPIAHRDGTQTQQAGIAGKAGGRAWRGHAARWRREQLNARSLGLGRAVRPDAALAGEDCAGRMPCIRNTLHCMLSEMAGVLLMRLVDACRDVRWLNMRRAVGPIAHRDGTQPQQAGIADKAGGWAWRGHVARWRREQLNARALGLGRAVRLDAALAGED